MNLRRVLPVLLLTMFGFASAARGDVQSVVRWFNLRSAAERRCVEVYLGPLSAHHLNAVNARRIAERLCADDRVYFPFATALGAEARASAPKFHSNRHRKRFQRAQIRVRNRSLEDIDRLGRRFMNEKHFSPITLGLFGASKAQGYEISEALRIARHPWSERVFRWRNNPSALQDWRVRQLRGGVFSGLIHTHIAKGNEEDIQSARALLETTFTQRADEESPYTDDFSEFTVVITSDEDVDTKLVPVDMQISWLPLQEDSCDFVLQ